MDFLKRKDRKTNTNTSDQTYLTCTFRPNYQKVPKLVRKNWDILSRSATTKELYRSDLRVGYKRPKKPKRHVSPDKNRLSPKQN